MITPAQCLEARALLKWSRERLGSRCGLSYGSIREFEIGKRTLAPEALSAIGAALKAAGVIFVEQNGEGPGVRLRKDRAP